MTATVAWDASNTLTVVGFVLSVGIAYVLYRKERNQRLADRAAATEERERERRNALVDVRLVSQRQPQTTTTSGTVSNWPETWFRISVVGGNIDTWVYLKRVAWRVDEDHWEELVGDEPPYIGSRLDRCSTSRRGSQ